MGGGPEETHGGKSEGGGGVGRGRALEVRRNEEERKSGGVKTYESHD